MLVGKSAYYAWLNRKPPSSEATAAKLNLYATIKRLFENSRESLGNREMVKKLRKEGFKIGRYKVRKIMSELGLVVRQRRAYKVTTKRCYSDAVAANLVNLDFEPKQPNELWAGDVTYLRTAEGWMYLAVVMDLFSRKIVGWALESHMRTTLVAEALQQAYHTRKPSSGLVFHSDRGSQYTSQEYRELLQRFDITPSMGDVGACWDNAVVERFFGSLKHDWILKVAQLTRAHLRADVAQYMRYYNMDRLHSHNGDLSPVQFESEFRNAA